MSRQCSPVALDVGGLLQLRAVDNTASVFSRSKEIQPLRLVVLENSKVFALEIAHRMPSLSRTVTFTSTSSVLSGRCIRWTSPANSPRYTTSR